MPIFLLEKSSVERTIGCAAAAKGMRTKHDDDGDAVWQWQDASEAIDLRLDGRITVHILIARRVLWPWLRPSFSSVEYS